MKQALLVFLSCLAVQVALSDKTNLMLTVDGVTYSNVTFGQSSPDQVIIFHSRGISGVPLEKLPTELQQRFRYDPQKAAEHRKKLDAADKERIARDAQRALDAAEKDRIARDTQKTARDRTPIFTLRGAGTQNTKPFTILSPWRIVWVGTRKTDKRTQRLSGRAVAIGIYSANGEVVGAAGNQTGEGSSDQPKGGTYYLRISGEGFWQVRVIPISE